MCQTSLGTSRPSSSGQELSDVIIRRLTEPVSNHIHGSFAYVCWLISRAWINDVYSLFLQPTWKDQYPRKKWRKGGFKSFRWIMGRGLWSIYWRSQNLGTAVWWARTSPQMMGSPLNIPGGKMSQYPRDINLLRACLLSSDLLLKHPKEPDPSMKVYSTACSVCIPPYC